MTTEAITLTEHWCPSGQRWTLCPGPCPDGRAHEPTREYVVDEANVITRAPDGRFRCPHCPYESEETGAAGTLAVMRHARDCRRSQSAATP